MRPCIVFVIYLEFLVSCEGWAICSMVRPVTDIIIQILQEIPIIGIIFPKPDVCRLMCPVNFDPVCGRNSENKNVSAANECELIKYNRCRGEDFKVVHMGFCATTPLPSEDPDSEYEINGII